MTLQKICFYQIFTYEKLKQLSYEKFYDNSQFIAVQLEILYYIL